MRKENMSLKNQQDTKEDSKRKQEQNGYKTYRNK